MAVLVASLFLAKSNSDLRFNIVYYAIKQAEFLFQHLLHIVFLLESALVWTPQELVHSPFRDSEFPKQKKDQPSTACFVSAYY